MTFRGDFFLDIPVLFRFKVWVRVLDDLIAELRDACSSVVDKRRGRSNCAGLFGMEKIPTDKHIRDMLDPVAPEALFAMFDRTLRVAETGGGLADFRRLGDRVPIALDGTEYHVSRKVSCARCSRRKRADGALEYHHQMVCGVLVAPGHERALPLAPTSCSWPSPPRTPP